ncbi:MAG: glycosyltransferase family 4 protein [Ignavibacteriales bacterium]|nr:MAG: glycosyltransferase family 4 protein [Ignavibacteriales bacterium]
MKVVLLGDPASAHMMKWANGIKSRGVDVLVYGLTPVDKAQYDDGIEIEVFKIPDSIKWKNDGNLLKSVYLLCLPHLKKTIKKFKCEILHGQSASSYGLIGALSGFHPNILSVWGNDVYIFPHKHILFKKLLMYSLSKADIITSSSKTMAKYSRQFTDKEILVTPGGIMLNKFMPLQRETDNYKANDIVVGTIKMMESKYGVEDILDAFNILVKKYPDIPLKLLLVGRGSLIDTLKSKSIEYGIEEHVRITGLIPFAQIPKYHNLLDIYLAPSTNDSESFGVGILEASACAKPVIVSNVGGLSEVVIDNETGFVVPPNNPKVLADKIETLVMDKELRHKMGKNGRKFVEEKYDYEKILDYIIEIYDSAIKKIPVKTGPFGIAN